MMASLNPQTYELRSQYYIQHSESSCGREAEQLKVPYQDSSESL